MLKNALLQIIPIIARKMFMFNIWIVPPSADIVPSTPGAEICAMKIKVGKAETTFSNVSVNTCEKQYTVKSEIPTAKFSLSACKK